MSAGGGKVAVGGTRELDRVGSMAKLKDNYFVMKQWLPCFL